MSLWLLKQAFESAVRACSSEVSGASSMLIKSGEYIDRGLTWATAGPVCTSACLPGKWELLFHTTLIPQAPAEPQSALLNPATISITPVKYSLHYSLQPEQANWN